MLLLFLLCIVAKQATSQWSNKNVNVFIFQCYSTRSSIINTTHKCSHPQKQPQTILSGQTQTSFLPKGFHFLDYNQLSSILTEKILPTFSHVSIMFLTDFISRGNLNSLLRETHQQRGKRQNWKKKKKLIIFS